MFGRKKNTIKEVGKMTLVFALGAAAGAAVALLVTPKSGKELRKDLKTGFDQLTEKAAEQAVHIGEEIKDAIGKIKVA